MDATLEGSAEKTPAPLTVTGRLGEPSVITVSGEADFAGADSLGQVIATALAHHPHVVFNLAGVSFSDSSFLNNPLNARASALERGGSVRLSAVSEPVQRLLEITGAIQLFPATADTDAGKA